MSAAAEVDVLALEEVAFRSWPAEEVGALDGWRLRHNHGVSRRASSVWPNRDDDGARPLEQRLAEVEAFYAARGQPALYQVTSAAAPAGLDAALAARGYTLEAPVAVEIAQAEAVATPPTAAAVPVPVPVPVQVEPSLTEPWFALSALRGRFAAVAPIYRGLLDRLEGRALFALAVRDGVPAGVGLGVIDGDWLGVFSMLTLPEHRRRGVGRAILGALAAAARARGVGRLYLQVELENEAARALYHGAGFREAYRYHYRRAPADRG